MADWESEIEFPCVRFGIHCVCTLLFLYYTGLWPYSGWLRVWDRVTVCQVGIHCVCGYYTLCVCALLFLYYTGLWPYSDWLRVWDRVTVCQVRHTLCVSIYYTDWPYWLTECSSISCWKMARVEWWMVEGENGVLSGWQYGHLLSGMPATPSVLPQSSL